MTSETLAAVDLGSNSFHLIVARRVGEELQVIDRLREPVRLAAALDRRGGLDRAGAQRALDCLGRFGQRLAHANPSFVRVVGTATLRKVRRSDALLARLREALGHEVEIISGREEARLIFLGVSHAVAPVEGPRLLIDIGGASSECMIGEGFEPELADSLTMGCVAWSQRYFPTGRLDRAAMRAARLAAAQKIEPIARAFVARGWRQALGSSGTIRAIAAIAAAEGWSAGEITPEVLRRLRRACYAAGQVERLALAGLDADRAAVLPGGLAVLSAFFEALGLARIEAAPAALREGLLWDLIGRIDRVDVRDRTINRMCERFVVDRAHAARVQSAALDLLDGAQAGLRLAGEWPRTLLSWATQLHEVGLAVAFSGYHRHSAYLIEHSDMPGFSRRDQRLLATMVRHHRRRLDATALNGLGSATQRRVARDLTVLLRVAVRLCRARSPEPLPPLTVRARPRQLSLTFPAGWLATHPLTVADLATEAERLSRIGWRLRYR